jgi:List-Bact-rpt repeat protein
MFTPRTISFLLSAGALALGVGAAHGQSAIIYGSVSNFDISNDTGLVCHGFQIDLDGLSGDQSAFSFNANRYGTPATVPYTGGVSVVWQSPLDPASGTFVERTLQHVVQWFPGQCYMWNPATYQDSGCEHFGTARGPAANITKVTARWLCEDPANPSALAPVDPPTAVPYASYYVQPPAQPALPVQVVMVVDPPVPPEAPQVYGDAQWTRVFVTELPREVGLDELVADNPQVVPMDPAQLESDWSLIQADPPNTPSGQKGKHSQKQNGKDLQPTTRAVVRRIETWEYTGAYDPVTHQALCADLTCTTPSPGETGALLATQMTAVNVQADSLTVTRSGTGGGGVSSADKYISCGNKCVIPYTAGTIVTLTAKADSGSVFTGWTGACAGTSLTCSVPVNGHTDVGATFATTARYSLSIGRSNPGTVTSDVGGINCGSTCSAKLDPDTVVTLTATPPAGKSFVGWSNGCSGTAPTCSVTLTKDTSVQASFSK